MEAKSFHQGLDLEVFEVEAEVVEVEDEEVEVVEVSNNRRRSNLHHQFHCPLIRRPRLRTIT